MFARDLVELRRKELGVFFRAKFGERWRRIVAVRCACSIDCVREYWPVDLRAIPACFVGTIHKQLVQFEDFARSQGFKSPLDSLASRIASKQRIN
jgi:hypothetical protein